MPAAPPGFTTVCRFTSPRAVSCTVVGGSCIRNMADWISNNGRHVYAYSIVLKGKNMKPILYFHAGFPKTGSKSIQTWLFKNRHRLSAGGCCYPAPQTDAKISINDYSHMAMCPHNSVLFCGATSPQVYARRYYKEIMESCCHLNILSLENLILREPGTILDCFSKDFDIKILCYIRNFFDYLSSLSKQFSMVGFSRDAFWQKRDLPLFVRGYADQYQARLGRDHCVWKNFDATALQGKLLTDFAETIGINHLITRDDTFQNRSVHDAVAMFFYQMQFLPIDITDYTTLRTDLLNVRINRGTEYRCTLLHQWLFQRDEEINGLIRYQGRLLDDPLWYEYTWSRGEELKKIRNEDLPAEIQHEILEQLSPMSCRILEEHCPNLNAKGNEHRPFLPAVNNLPDPTFSLLAKLRTAYVISQMDLHRQVTRTLRKHLSRSPAHSSDGTTPTS